MSLPKNSLLLRYLPLNYSQIYNTNDGGQSDSGQAGGGASGGGGLSADQMGSTGTPRRSLSQTILSQMNSPTTAFGLTGRSPSPSPFMSSHALSRKSSFNRNFMTRGPSLQSLVKSFINRVSRGTQTDSDDNFDQISIASVTSGFSAIANDLSQSRLKLFLNDGHQNSNHKIRQTKSYASSQVDDNEFVEELQKLRDEINGEFGDQVSEQYTANQFDMEDLSEEPTSVQSQKEVFSLLVPSKARTFVDAQMTTDTLPTRDSYTQTDQPKKVEKVEKAVETKKAPEISQVLTQTSAPTSPEKKKPQMKECETQTDEVKFCNHNCELMNNKNDHSLLPNGNVVKHYNEQPPAAPQPTTIIVQHAPAPPPQIMKCEFLISHADIICKENKVIRNRSDSNNNESSSSTSSPAMADSSAQVNTTVLEKDKKQLSSTSDTKPNEEVKVSREDLTNEKTEQIEEITEKLKVNDLQALPINGHQQNSGNSKGNSSNIDKNSEIEKQSSVPSTPLKSTVATATTSKPKSPLLANGGLEKDKNKENDKKKAKKEKEKEKKTPKKSPRKVLMAIIPGSDDEEREKNHQVALGHVRPKCCTIS